MEPFADRIHNTSFHAESGLVFRESLTVGLLVIRATAPCANAKKENYYPGSVCVLAFASVGSTA